MATVDYPVGLPTPLISQLSRNDASGTITKGRVKGPPVVEKWTDNQVGAYSFVLSLSPTQKRAFDGWFFHNTDNGALSFNMDLPIGVDEKGQVRSVEVNFNGSAPATQHRAGRIRLSATVTMKSIFRDTKAFSDSYLALLSTGDDPLIIIAALEKLVNVDLGKIA